MGGFIHCKYEQDSDTKGVVDKVMPIKLEKTLS